MAAYFMITRHAHVLGKLCGAVKVDFQAKVAD
jgi:hypothetical protein